MAGVGRRAGGGQISILFVLFTFLFILFTLVVPLFLVVLLFSLAKQVVQDLVHKGLYVTRRSSPVTASSRSCFTSRSIERRTRASRPSSEASCSLT